MSIIERTPESLPPLSTLPRRRLPGSWKPAFLRALELTANVTLSAKLAGVSPWGAQKARKTDAKFDEAWQEALDAACDALELEAMRRAMLGWDEPVFQKGEQVGVIRKYDSNLLIFLLKAHRPERFREQILKLEHTQGDASEIDREIRRLMDEMETRAKSSSPPSTVG